jgi:hypothetical protein
MLNDYAILQAGMAATLAIAFVGGAGGKGSNNGSEAS